MPPSTFVFGYASLGQWDAAFEWMDQAFEARDPLIMPIQSYHFLIPVRDDPRYRALLRRMNLPPGDSQMIGQTVSHYRILAKLGEGGMGVVYQAEDTALQRTVALKFLPPELTRDAEAKQRFLHEARAAAALNHPNIVTVHEINEHEDPAYIVMEYVEGQT